jgi:hypothetical protein
MKQPTDTVGICVDLERFGRVELELGFARLKYGGVIDQ